MARPPQASARGLFVRLDNGSWLRIRVFSTEEMLERVRINGCIVDVFTARASAACRRGLDEQLVGRRNRTMADFTALTHPAKIAAAAAR